MISESARARCPFLAAAAWEKVAGAATRFAVGPDGTPWLVNAEGSIYRRTGSAWTKLSGCARDITWMPPVQPGSSGARK